MTGAGGVEGAALLAALAAGGVTSLHCVGMCGPLACGVCLRQAGRRFPALLTYHAARIGSYVALGALAGALGRLVAGDFLRPLATFFPWVFLVFFATVVLGWDKRAGRALQGSPVLAPLLRRAGSGGTIAAAGVLGLATPFLPCGPLYLMVGTAILSGSGLAGGVLLAAFAFGTIPFPLAVQAGVSAWGGRLAPLTLDRLRRGFALVSMVLLLGRAWIPFDAPVPIFCR